MNAIKNANASKHQEYINKQMDLATSQVNTAQESIQKLAVMVLYHSMRYKDNSGANIMLNKLPSGIRKQALVNWFTVFGGFKFDSVLSEFTTNFDSDKIHTSIKEAKAKKWWTVGKERLNKPWDANEEFLKFVKSFQNHKRKLDGMSEEDKKKFSFVIKGELIQNFLAMVDFEAILIEDEIEKLEDHLNVA